MSRLCIIPAHDEAGSLPGLLAEIHREGFDAVVVDDCSSDDTAAVARAAGAALLPLPVNLGIGGAVQTGYLHARDRGYDVAVQIDGDGQHDPGYLDALLAPIREGRADLVVGSRYLPEAPDTGYTTPLPRRLGMRFSSALLRFATGLQIHDTTSGLRAMNRRAVGYAARHYPTDHPEAEALLMYHQAGFRILEVPVRMRARSAGQSLFTFVRSALYPLRVMVGFVGIVARHRRPGAA